MILHIGRINEKEISGGECGVIGSFRIDALRCNTSMIIGGGHIGFLASQNLVLKAIRNIFIDYLFAGQSIIMGVNRPILIGRMAGEWIYADRVIIRELVLKSTLLAGPGLTIYRLKGSPTIVFLDPYVRLGEINGSPRYIFTYKPFT